MQELPEHFAVSGTSDLSRREQRRSFLGAAGGMAALGAAGLAASAPAHAAQSSTESLLDVWTRTKKARIGVDLNNKPLRFKDENGKPAGLGIEFLELLLNDMGVEPVYTEMPFGQTFAALAAGKFDMIGTFVTILPGRALRGAFAGFPAYYQQNVAYLKEGRSIGKLAELNAPGVKVACQQGTSEATTLRALFPQAEIQTFPQLTDATSAVGTGRVDALITDALFAQNVLKAYPQVTVHGETVNAIPNTFFMAADDFKLWAYITNWLRYQGALRTMVGLQQKWFGTEAQDKYNIPLISVGSGGEPVEIKQG
ncbi:amino acid ABC transporter substrate-binding protein [Verticiella sediminum]|uniref:Amino acid ABC transporter substrate-binding protein n=1 Tax=Verticiella sediminum TaxID=1247510 RepID=A0A556AIZ8_9BURK|nr:ABC transporter substrate-binding protein [Verticiella sediminum]TSH92840.1 amino acid ABC transporter substrate-binding protein [Verticiella sediminum]